jgi:hypothetical protein
MKKSLFLLLFCIAFSCQNETIEEKLKKNHIEDFKYFLDFVKDYNRNDTVVIDTFNYLYNSLKAIYLNDSVTVFASLNRNRFLLFIYPDSISVYLGAPGLLFSELEIKNLLLENKIGEIIDALERKYSILYKSNLGNRIFDYIVYDKNKKACFIIMNYQYIVYSYCFSWNYYYIKRIKNDFIRLDKIKFKNSYPYNSTLKYLKFPEGKRL